MLSAIRNSLLVVLVWSSAVCAVNEEVQTAASVANNKFALDLLKKLYSNDKNVFFSPQSIAMAVAMTSLGARGNTLSEIDAAFHFDDVKSVSSDSMDLHESFKDLMNSYVGGNETFDLVHANRLFSADGLDLLSQFVEDTENYYKAGIQQVNFTAGAAEQIINDWVAEQTHDLIKELFQPGSLGSDVLLVLVNAIYFKGVWKNEFKTERTFDRDFHVTGDVSKTVKMMSKYEVELPYYSDAEKKLKLLEMPYMGDKISMVILLPEQGALPTLVSDLTTATLDNLLSKLSNREVNIQIPKFRVEAEYPLRETLQHLGVNDLFSNTADLSGICNNVLKVSQVQHKAFVEVDEVGTKAAAVTGVVAANRILIISPQFIADHPFVFFIIDKTTHNRILFAGALHDP